MSSRPHNTRWTNKSGRVSWLAVVRDPGPPTWREATDGFEEFRRQAAIEVRRTREALMDIPPTDQDGDRMARGAFSVADAEWKSWNEKLAAAQAFVRLHPTMADELIVTKCEHVGRRGNCMLMDAEETDSSEAREPGSDDDEDRPS